MFIVIKMSKTTSRYTIIDINVMVEKNKNILNRILTNLQGRKSKNKIVNLNNVTKCRRLVNAIHILHLESP